MSKILRIVGDGPERRTYVADGPECGGCNGKREVVIALRYGKSLPATPCPCCHGTGLQPVEEWPDARKAEWLKKELDNNVWITPNKKEWVVIHADDDAYWLSDEYLAVNKDFSQALTAAVIAVAEEQE